MFEAEKETLKTMLKPERYQHSLGVADSAMKLAQTYQYPKVTDAYLVGLLHDCAKNIPKDEQIKICLENGVTPDKIEQITNGLIHAKTGAVLAKTIFHVTDEALLNAIRYHCTGRANMSLLEKIVYLADMIEPSRHFDNLAALRKRAFENLDEALILQMNITISFNLTKNSILHPDTINARNYLLIQKRETLQPAKKMVE